MPGRYRWIGAGDGCEGRVRQEGRVARRMARALAYAAAVSDARGQIADHLPEMASGKSGPCSRLGCGRAGRGSGNGGSRWALRQAILDFANARGLETRRHAHERGRVRARGWAEARPVERWREAMKHAKSAIAATVLLLACRAEASQVVRDDGTSVQFEVVRSPSGPRPELAEGVNGR